MTARKSTTPRTLNWDAKAGTLVIKEGKLHDVYFVEEFYPAPGFGSGRAFELRKHVRTADRGLYHVLAAGEASQCDCRGFVRHGHCRHAAAMVKLLALGLIADPRCNGEADVSDTEVNERPDPADLQGGF